MTEQRLFFIIFTDEHENIIIPNLLTESWIQDQRAGTAGTGRKAAEIVAAEEVIMEQKLIFLDIDGTLTEPGKNVPPDSALAAIRRAHAKGHKAILCSGRNYGMLFPLLKYGFDGVISCAGGCIEYDGKVVYDCPMTQEQQNRVLAVFQESGVYRTIGSRDHTYTDEGFKAFLAQNSQSKANSELLRWRVQLESTLDIRPMAEYNGEPIYGLTFMSPGQERLKMPMEALKDEFDFCIQDTDACGIVNGELISKAFNKGTAVIRLSKHLGIAIKNTIAFGDSMNDLEMLQTAGYSVCMGNGSKHLKNVANMVCPPVNQDGLYRAFMQLGLI